MKNARVFVGNSSTGVREAPFVGVPSLDVGTRQSNRALAESVHHCDALDVESIESFLVESWGTRYEPHGGYGTGNAAKCFTKLLLDRSFWNRPMQKYFSDTPNYE